MMIAIHKLVELIGQKYKIIIELAYGKTRD